MSVNLQDKWVHALQRTKKHLITLKSHSLIDIKTAIVGKLLRHERKKTLQDELFIEI